MTKTKLTIILLLILLLSIGSFFIVRYFKNKPVVNDPYGVWEVMVVIRSQKMSSDPVQDAKEALKRGDAIAVREENHKWSDTEYKSYLLVKIKGKKSQVEKLLEPVEKKNEVVLARKYKVDLEKIGFTGDQVIHGQPLKDKVFGADIIIKK